jgi:hypothetical protein
MSGGMVGRNFLAWHRQFLVRLEHRLQLTSSNVTILYWDWIEQPDLPEELSGGTMGLSLSPTDPLFWLHHANVDRIWGEWQTKHPNANPPNSSEILRPPPLFDNQVSSVLSISNLGYSYV